MPRAREFSFLHFEHATRKEKMKLIATRSIDLDTFSQALLSEQRLNQIWFHRVWTSESSDASVRKKRPLACGIARASRRDVAAIIGSSSSRKSEAVSESLLGVKFKSLEDETAIN